MRTGAAKLLGLPWLLRKTEQERANDETFEGKGEGMFKQREQPETGYEEWFRLGVEESLADTSPAFPQAQVENEVNEFLRAKSQEKTWKVSA